MAKRTDFRSMSRDFEDLIKNVQEEVNPEKNPYVYFNRFRVPTYDPFLSNIAYIFFTRPDCNFDQDNISASNYFSSLSTTSFGQSILSSLSSGNYSPNQVTGSFIKILSNSVTNFETKDTSLATDSLHENFVGYKLTLPSTYVESITADTITLNFLEYEDLRVTNLIKAWVEYINGVKRGYFTAADYNISQKIIDYSSSIYFFLCAPDGHSIRFFTKLTGCFPINIPYSAFSWEIGNAPDDKKLSVTFQYQIKEDLDIEIINDFNKLSANEDAGETLGDAYKDSWASNVYVRDGKLQFLE